MFVQSTRFKEVCELLLSLIVATRNFSENPATFNDFLACVSKHFQN